MSACTSVIHSSFITTRTPAKGVFVRSLSSSMIAFMAFGLMFSLLPAACMVAALLARTRRGVRNGSRAGCVARAARGPGARGWWLAFRRAGRSFCLSCKVRGPF